MTRRIVKPASICLREILEAQLSTLHAIALQRQLDRTEMQNLELMLKVYDRLPQELTGESSGNPTRPSKPLSQNEIRKLINIVESAK